MERAQLKSWIDAGLSLETIAALVHRHPSTVGYWVKQHGLLANGRAKHAPKGGLSREALAPLLDQGETLRGIAAKLGVSVATVRHWLMRHGLETAKARGERPALARAAIADGSGRFQFECRRHGITTFVAYPDGRSRCARCSSESVAARRRRVKLILVEEAGGCCELCGYDSIPAALEFHHLDPAAKSFALSGGGMTRSIDALRDEARKCALLCATCHAEVEAGHASVPIELPAVRS